MTIFGHCHNQCSTIKADSPSKETRFMVYLNKNTPNTWNIHFQMKHHSVYSKYKPKLTLSNNVPLVFAVIPAECFKKCVTNIQKPRAKLQRTLRFIIHNAPLNINPRFKLYSSSDPTRALFSPPPWVSARQDEVSSLVSGKTQLSSLSIGQCREVSPFVVKNTASKLTKTPRSRPDF